MYDYVLKGRIIDGISNKPIEKGIIAIRGDKIAYVGEENRFEMSNAMEIIECDTILPGFIDCHAHLVGIQDAGDICGNQYSAGGFFGDQLLGAAYQVGLLVDAGFTSVRDMSEQGFYLSRAQERGILRSPRIMPGGRCLGTTSGHIDMWPNMTKRWTNENSPISRMCDGVDDCVLAVREQFRNGAKFIKICATGGVSSPTDRVDDIQFSPEELRAIVEETKRHHSYVAAHCTGNEGAYQALLAGVECIEHGVMLTQREIDIMAEKNIPLVSTLAISLSVAKMKGLPEWMEKKAKNAAECNLKTIEMAKKANIKIALGTDFTNSKGTPYLKNGREFEAMVEAGLTPMESIKAGTINAAYVLRKDKEIGSLEVGKLADITLVEGNPLEDIKCIGDAENIKAVFINGKKVK